MSTQPIVAPSKTEDFMPLHGIDHVEFYVGNALQAASFWVRALGFKEVAYAGLETGVRDRASHVLEQGRIRIVLTGALIPGHEIGRARRPARRRREGDRAVACRTSSTPIARRSPAAPRASREPHEISDDHGTVQLAPASPPTARRCTRSSTAADYKGPFLPGYTLRDVSDGDTGLLAIDHIVGNVELGHMDRWVKYYEDVFGMREMIHFSDEDISTEYSALMSKVVTSGNGRVKFPLNEPAEGKRKSQIDEYLEYYGGAGAQHIAVATRDIVAHGRAAARSAGSSSCARPRPTTTTCPSGSARSPRTSRTSAGSASSSTATTRATCCRSSRSRSATARRSSSR